MAITTLQNNERSFPTFLIYALGIIGVGLVVFFGGQVLENWDNLKGKAGISVDVVGEPATVTIDNEANGKTPFTSKDLKPGTKKITIKNSTRQYQTQINFIPSSDKLVHLVGIIRDLGVSDFFSSGQEFWFEKENSGKGLVVISDPSDAKVSIDGFEVGKTPFSSNISPGDYEFTISAPGYETQKGRISVQKGYTLNGSIKLFPLPLNDNAKVFEGSKNLYDLSTGNNSISSDTQTWVKAIIYWNKNRGITIGNEVPDKNVFFSYYIDYQGNIFDYSGNLVNTTDSLNKLKDSLKDSPRGAYLGRTSDGTGLTKEAKDALESLSGAITSGKTATIKQTPTGWLRVRDSASLSGTEISKVNTGTKYSVLEEKTGWVKIKVSDTISGWVSSDYVTLSE